MTDRELFEFIDVEEMLTEMGLRNVRNTYSGEIEFSCPFPGHSSLDAHPSAYMATVERQNPEGGTYPKTTFHCFTCGAKGTAIALLAEYEGISPVAAKRMLRERFAPGWTGDSEKPVDEVIRSILEEKQTMPPAKMYQALDESVLDEFALNWPEIFMAWEATGGEGIPEPLAYMLNRGFEPETLEDFDIGYDERSSYITIPARNADGIIIGLKGRAWWSDARPKYKGLGGEGYGFATYEMGRVLWALDKARKAHGDEIDLIVREGELNAMMLHQQGYTNAVGISGKRVSTMQRELIKKYARSVTFWFDDEADSAEAASNFLYSMPCFLISSDNDPADSTPEENKTAINAAESALSLFIV